MDGAIVYQWTKIVPGREAAATEFMNESKAYADRQVANGTVTDYAWYFTAQGGVNLFIVRGDMDKLMSLASDPELMVLTWRAALICEGYAWSFSATGDAAWAVNEMFAKEAAQLS